MKAMLAELGRDLASEKLVPALSCGMITGVQLLVFSISMAAAIFSGPLTPFLSLGIGLVLFGYCAISTIVALGSGFRGAVAGAPLPSVMMMLVITTSVDLEGMALYATSVTAALIGTMAAFPVPLIGGVLLFLGLRMMDDWLVAARRRLAWTDSLIILVMFATIVVFGFLEGVGIGMLITSAIFVDRRGAVPDARARTRRPRAARTHRPAANARALRVSFHGGCESRRLDSGVAGLAGRAGRSTQHYGSRRRGPEEA